MEDNLTITIQFVRSEHGILIKQFSMDSDVLVHEALNVLRGCTESASIAADKKAKIDGYGGLKFAPKPYREGLRVTDIATISKT